MRQSSQIFHHIRLPLVLVAINVAFAAAFVPLKDDSLGLSSFFTILCVLFPSLATGAGTAHLFRRRHRAGRIAVPAVAAVAIGASAAAVAARVTGFGDYVSVAGIVALFSLAISAPTAALGRIKLPLIGLAGIALLLLHPARTWLRPALSHYGLRLERQP